MERKYNGRVQALYVEFRSHPSFASASGSYHNTMVRLMGGGGGRVLEREVRRGGEGGLGREVDADTHRSQQRGVSACEKSGVALSGICPPEHALTRAWNR